MSQLLDKTCLEKSSKSRSTTFSGLQTLLWASYFAFRYQMKDSNCNMLKWFLFVILNFLLHEANVNIQAFHFSSLHATNFSYPLNKLISSSLISRSTLIISIRSSRRQTYFRCIGLHGRLDLKGHIIKQLSGTNFSRAIYFSKFPIQKVLYC